MDEILRPFVADVLKLEEVCDRLVYICMSIMLGVCLIVVQLVLQCIHCSVILTHYCM